MTAVMAMAAATSHTLIDGNRRRPNRINPIITNGHNR